MSIAKELLPDPEGPVMTVRVFFGISTSIFFRLCSRAPLTFIHSFLFAMPANVEEVLYNAMEHFRVDVIIGQGAGAKSINLPISPFTLVGATTKSGMTK